MSRRPAPRALLAGLVVAVSLAYGVQAAQPAAADLLWSAGDQSAGNDASWGGPAPTADGCWVKFPAGEENGTYWAEPVGGGGVDTQAECEADYAANSWLIGARFNGPGAPPPAVTDTVNRGIAVGLGACLDTTSAGYCGPIWAQDPTVTSNPPAGDYGWKWRRQTPATEENEVYGPITTTAGEAGDSGGLCWAVITTGTTPTYGSIKPSTNVSDTDDTGGYVMDTATSWWAWRPPVGTELEFEGTPYCASTDPGKPDGSDGEGSPPTTTTTTTAPSEECEDGIDNDSDGQTDYPYDLECVSETDPTEGGEVEECGDGIDNDGDTKIDYPEDSSCTSLLDTTEDSEDSDDSDCFNWNPLSWFKGLPCFVRWLVEPPDDWAEPAEEVLEDVSTKAPFSLLVGVLAWPASMVDAARDAVAARQGAEDNTTGGGGGPDCLWMTVHGQEVDVLCAKKIAVAYGNSRDPATLMLRSPILLLLRLGFLFLLFNIARRTVAK